MELPQVDKLPYCLAMILSITVIDQAWVFYVCICTPTCHGTRSMAHRTRGYKKKKKKSFIIIQQITFDFVNCPLFFPSREKIYIIQHTIKFIFRSSSFGYTEVKTSAVLKIVRETTSDRPSPKVPRSSQILSQSCLIKMDKSRPVEAGACHKVLIMNEFNVQAEQSSSTSPLVYRSLLSSTKTFFFFIQLFTPVLQNTIETFYQISEACNPDKGFLCQKKNGTWLQMVEAAL